MTHNKFPDVSGQMAGESALMANLCGPMAEYPIEVHMMHLVVCYLCN
jgi:hypothetical protein